MRQPFLALLIIAVSLNLFADEAVQFIGTIERMEGPSTDLKVPTEVIAGNLPVTGISQDFLPYPDESVGLDDPQAIGDTYSMAPLVESANGAAYLTPSPEISNHTFTNDGTVESGGFNLTGSVLLTSKFQVREFRSDLGGGVSRYHVEMRAVNSDVAGTREPWVSSAFSGNEFIKWRLDVGSTAGGSDQLEPGFAFAVVNSAANGYTTTGQPIGTSTFFDTSTTSGLSGVVQVFNGGSNIAGVGLAEIRMYWDIVASPDLEILSVDATDGAYLPGSDLRVAIPMKNNGSVASGTTGVVSVYASTDNIISTGDTLLASFNPDLDAGEQKNYAGDFRIPPGLANGNYYIGAILDYDDPDPTNNSAFDPVTILVSDQPEIHIRPLSLQLTEPGVSPAQAPINRKTAISPKAYSETQLPLLLDRARNDGSVRVIVGFDSGSQAEGRLSEAGKLSQRQVISDQGATLLNALQGMNYQENARYQFIPYMGLTVDASALQELADLPMVTSIEEDRLSAPHLDSSNPVIGSAAAWAAGYDGSGQTIAILDTGVDKAHPWFSTGGSKVVTEACYSSNTASSTSVCPAGVEESVASGSGVHCSNTVSGCDHGTHVAGIAAGNSGAGTQFGVARGANIAAMQVFSVFSSAASCGDAPAPCVLSYSSDQIKALERVFALRNTHDFAAVNMSLGGGQYSTSAACDAANVSLKAAISNLRSVGIATIISSGNDGYVDSIGAPGCISTAVSVGNTTDSDLVAGSSNIYPEIHLLAPGTSITSAVPGTGTGVKSGTSMAAPHVAGAWAVLKQANTGSTVDEILTALQLSGTAVNDQRSGGVETNMPRINVDLALGGSLTSFSILNEGPVALTITSITRETTAPWIGWSPAAPFNVQPGELKVVTVTADFDSAPEGTTQTRLLVSSNDANESPYPGGVLVNVTPLPGPGNIIVDKVTSPVGSSQIFDFTLTGTGVNQSFSLTHSATPYKSGDLRPTLENGTYNVAETMPPGWTGSGSCSDGSPPSAVDLMSDETVTCTFTNTIGRGKIIVDKTTNPTGSIQSFNFSISGTGVNQGFSLTDAATPYDSGDLLPTSENGTYNVAETMPPGWTGSGSCSDGSPATAVDLAPGETVTCTFTNTIGRGVILVDKVTDPVGSSQSFEFTLTGNGVDQSFSLADETALYSSGELIPTSDNGTYNVAETLPPKWSNTESSCSDGSPPNAVDLAAGETVTCTFINTEERSELIYSDGFEEE